MLPEDDDAGHGGIHLKDKQAEERAIVDIAQTLKVFAFQSLIWNQQATEENIICRVRENPDNFRKFHEDDESDLDDEEHKQRGRGGMEYPDLDDDF